MVKLGAVLASVLSLLLFGACSESDDGGKRASGYFDGARLIALPPGGADLGSLEPLEIATREGVIESLDEVHGYPFTLVSDGYFVASVESVGGLNPFVELYDAAGIRVSGNDNGGNDRDALLVGYVEAGDYTLLVWPSLVASSTGSYVMSVAAGTPTGDDLLYLRSGETIEPLQSYEIAGGGDVSTFIFTTSDDGFVSFEVTTSAGMADLSMRLRAPNGDLIFFENPVGPVDPVKLSQQLPRGTYILTIENGEFALPGEYNVRLTASP